MTPTAEERRIEPRTGIIHLKVSEKGSLLQIRPLGSPTERTITIASWITWDRHEWPVAAQQPGEAR